MALASSFLTYMETSRHLLFYRLGSYPLPMGFHFPHVTSLSLVHCTPAGVSQLLHPSYFPALQRIHYLSGHPGDTLIHRRFLPQAQQQKQKKNRVEWLFPADSHPFYDAMVEAGWGRRDDWLVMNHVASYKRIQGDTWFDLYLEGKGILCGKWYYNQQMAYLRRGHYEALEVPYPVVEEEMPAASILFTSRYSSKTYDMKLFHKGVMQSIAENKKEG